MASVLVPLAQGCEEIEAVTIVDLLRRGGVEVVTAGLDERPVRASRGTVLVPDTTLEQVLERDFDMIALPGGQPGADNLAADERLQRLLQHTAGRGAYTAAICAAPRVLADAGLLHGRQATSFPGALDDRAVENLTYREQPVVTDRRVVTSRGPGTAMDFALHLLELLQGRAKRDEVEAALQRPPR
ncbi:MAG: DJ-1/PfpI family protein [Gammaproteobacteria bacterium]